MPLESKELENKLERAIDRAIQRNMMTTVSILGSLIVIVGAIATFAHSFMH